MGLRANIFYYISCFWLQILQKYFYQRAPLGLYSGWLAYGQERVGCGVPGDLQKLAKSVRNNNIIKSRDDVTKPGTLHKLPVEPAAAPTKHSHNQQLLAKIQHSSILNIIDNIQ